MKSNSLVSIVVPCYNGGQFIAETINSVLKQTYPTIELIIINDGSTDDSLVVINKFNEDRIVLIDKENSGVSDSRNVGLKASKGEFILFLDADDLIQENFIERSISFFDLHPEIDFLTTAIDQIDENSLEIKNSVELKGTYQNVQYEIASFQLNISTCPSAYIFRKSKLVSNGILFNSSLSSPADRYYLLEVGAYLKGALLTNNKLKYRVHANSMSQLKNKKLIVDQENYLEHTLKNKIIASRRTNNLFKRKLCYQLFVDYAKMFHFKKAFKYGGKFLLSYVF